MIPVFYYHFSSHFTIPIITGLAGFHMRFFKIKGSLGFPVKEVYYPPRQFPES